MVLSTLSGIEQLNVQFWTAEVVIQMLKKCPGTMSCVKRTHQVMTANWISGFLEIGLT